MNVISPHNSPQNYQIMKSNTFLFGYIFLVFVCLSGQATGGEISPPKPSAYQDAKYYVSVAVVYFKMHENERAEIYIDSALQVDRSYAYAHVLVSKLSERLHGNHPETIQILTYALKSTNSNHEKIQLYCKISNLQIEDKNYPDCLQTIANIFQIDAQSPAGFFEKALLHYKLKQYQEVIKITEKALNITSDKNRVADFNFLMGLAHKQLNHHRKAEKHFVASLSSSLQNAAKIELELLQRQ